MKKNLAIALSFSLLALCPASWPQVLELQTILKGSVTMTDAQHMVMTPETAIALSLRDSRELALYKALVSQKRWEFAGALSHLLPSADANLSLEKFTGSDVIVGGSPFDIDRVTQRHRIGLGYDFNLRTVADARVYKLRLDQGKRQYDRIRQQILLDTLKNYYTWLKDLAAVEAMRQSYTEALIQRKQDELRQKTGFGTQLEVEQSAVSEAEREGDLYETEARRLASEHEFVARLSLPLTMALTPGEDNLEPVRFWTEEDKELPALYGVAMKNRPDVQELETAIKEAKASRLAAVSDYAPDIQLYSYVGNVGPELGQMRRMFSRRVSVNFDMMRYMGVETFSNIQAEHARVKQAIANKENELNRIRDDLAKAYYEWQLAQKNSDVSLKKLASAREAFRIAQARQQTGIGIHLEVIQAQTKLAEAAQEHAEAVMQYNNTQLQLMYETGTLTPERVLTAYELRLPPDQDEYINNIRQSSNDGIQPAAALERVDLSPVSLVPDAIPVETKVEGQAPVDFVPMLESAPVETTTHSLN